MLKEDTPTSVSLRHVQPVWDVCVCVRERVPGCISEWVSVCLDELVVLLSGNGCECMSVT